MFIIGDGLGRRGVFIFSPFTLVVNQECLFSKAPLDENACIRSKIESLGYPLPGWRR
jgi:hypothetical protein